jgi:hypothetical protein
MLTSMELRLARYARYRASTKGRARTRRYNAGASGKATAARYRSTVKGLFTRMLWTVQTNVIAGKAQLAALDTALAGLAPEFYSAFGLLSKEEQAK